MTRTMPAVSNAERLNVRLENFWEETLRDMRRIKAGDGESWETRELPFPLSRVKRLMRVEETVSSCRSHIFQCFSCYCFIVDVVTGWVRVLRVIELYCSSCYC